MALSEINDSDNDGRPELPLKTRGTVIAGLSCIAIALGGFGAWSATAPISSAVIAQGVLTVDSSRKTIQHLEGGAIKEILVRDGSRVRQGDVLVRLDPVQAKARLGIVQGALDSARALEARLLAERDGGFEIRFPAQLAMRADAPEIRAILDGQRALFDARRRSREGEIDILRQRIGQYDEQIIGLKSQEKAKKSQISLIRSELKGLQELLAKGHTTKPRTLALRREAAKLGGERGEHVANIARTRMAIGEARLSILQLDKRLRQDVEKELREVQTKIFDLAERLSAARNVLNHIEIRAPTAGVVVNTVIHTVGGVIRAGETILEIVPGDDRLIVEARVQPIDVDSLAVDLPASVRFTAFKQRSTPSVIGRVSYVSADGLVDAKSGQSFYLARIEVPDEQLKLLAGKKLQPGMPAEIIINTGDRSALDYLVQPILDSMNRAWREE